ILLDLLAAVRVPQPNYAIGAAGYDAVAVSRTSQVPDADKLGKLSKLFAGVNVPKVHDAIVAGVNEPVAFSQVGDGRRSRGSSEQATLDLAFLQVPDKHGWLRAARSSVATVWRDRDMVHIALMPFEGADLLTGLQIPEAERLVRPT